MAGQLLPEHGDDAVDLSTAWGLQLFEGKVADCKACHKQLHLDITNLFKQVGLKRGLFGKGSVFFLFF
jgi:cytochrome c peroxidase